MTVAFFFFILGTVVIYFILNTSFSKKTDIKYILLGVASLCYSLSIHRFFWGLRRISLELQWKEIFSFIELNAWLALIPSFLVLSSIALILAPAASHLVPSKKLCTPYLVIIFFIVSVYWFAFVKIGEIKYNLKMHKQQQINQYM